jgi:hypothetical protein
MRANLRLQWAAAAWGMHVGAHCALPSHGAATEPLDR